MSWVTVYVERKGLKTSLQTMPAAHGWRLGAIAGHLVFRVICYLCLGPGAQKHFPAGQCVVTGVSHLLALGLLVGVRGLTSLKVWPRLSW